MMKALKAVLLVAATFALAACARPAVSVKALLPEEGEVYLYLEPFPQDAGRLAFSLAEVSAVKGDGIEIPLHLAITDFASGSIRRQRLMASGTLPEGEYRGLSFRVQKATLRSEDGIASLLVSPKAEMVEFPFHVGKQSASVVSLTFRFRESVKGGFGFSPSFAMETPANPLPTLTGYVSNGDANTVTVFDKRAGKVARIIETGRGPAGIAIDQVRMKGYVAVSGDDRIEVIDIRQNEIVSRVQLHSGDAPGEIALTPDGRTLVTVNTGSNTVSFVDPVSQTELGRVTVGNHPGALLLDRGGKRAYVFNTLSNTISVVDIANQSVSSTITTESVPLRGQFNRKGDRLYISHSHSPIIVVIDPQSFAQLKRFQAGMGVAALKVNPFNDLLYVGKDMDGTVDVYDPFSFIPGDLIPTEGGVSYLTVDGEEKNLAVIHGEKRTVQLINLTSKKEAATIDVGAAPRWVALFGER